MAVKNSVTIWCRKLQGSPSPKYVVDVQRRFFFAFGASGFATVQRWSSGDSGAASFFRGGGALRAARTVARDRTR